MKRNVKMFKKTTIALTLALSITQVGYFNPVTAKADDEVNNTEESNITYYTAKMYDYEQSNRDSQGFFYNGTVDEENNEVSVATDDGLFLFNQDNENPRVGSKPGHQNSWEKAFKNKIYSGLVKNEIKDGAFELADGLTAVSDNKVINLFDENSEQYVASYNFPFEKVADGYIEFDSSKNHVRLTTDLNENGNYDVERLDYASSVGFMPFNKIAIGRSGNPYFVDEKNFYFGMELAVPFYMTNDGMVKGDSGEKQAMEFKFSGDDDIWVYIDNKLVLDLGGVHDSVDGTINFATGEVSTTGNHLLADGTIDPNKTTEVVKSDVLSNLSKGTHTIKVFYLERGGQVSNCRVLFRLENTDGEEEEEDLPTPPPFVTEDPEVTPEPEETEDPEETPEPEVTEDPEETPEPEVTEDPKVTPTPETTTPPPVVTLPSDDIPLSDPEDEPEEVTPTPVVTTIPGEDVPLSDPDVEPTLPQTGTVSPVVFYLFGATLISMGSLVLTGKKKEQ